jgi:hypothetical protein
MTDKVITRRLDDLHAKEGREVEADQRYNLSLGGTDFQIDLSQENAAEFEKLLGRYLDAATKLEAKTGTNGKRGPRSVSSTGRRKTSPEYAKQIREWAADQGIVMKDKGPLPLDVKRQYAEAHNLELTELN